MLCLEFRPSIIYSPYTHYIHSLVDLIYLFRKSTREVRFVRSFFRGAATSGGRRARDYLSSLSRADITSGGGGTPVAGSTTTAVGGNETLSVANSSPLTLSNEDLSSTRSMSPRFNSTLLNDGQQHQNGHSNGQ